jgi:hypothetical protein
MAVQAVATAFQLPHQQHLLRLSRPPPSSSLPAQLAVVKEMVGSGELAMAEEYRKTFGLAPDVVAISAAQLKAEEEARAAQYLQLALPAQEVLFVGDEASLAEAVAALEGATVVGLDVEWKPSTGGGEGNNPASILQVRCQAGCLYRIGLRQGMSCVEHLACRVSAHRGKCVPCCSLPSGHCTPKPDATTVSTNGKQCIVSMDASTELREPLQVATASKALIFDLLALGSSPGLDACLAPVLGSADVIKLGFDVYGDLAKLAASYPGTQVGISGACGGCAVCCVVYGVVLWCA